MPISKIKCCVNVIQFSPDPELFLRTFLIYMNYNFVILRYLCFIEYIVFRRSSCCSKLAIVTEIGGGNETGNLVPHGDFLLRYVPVSEFTVQRTTQKVPIILKMTTKEK